MSDVSLTLTAHKVNLLSKVCCICHKRKTLYEFHRDKGQVFERGTKCITCKLAYNKRFFRDKDNQYAAKIAHANRNARAHQLNAFGEITLEEWNDILKSHGNKCLRCGTEKDITLDHVVPLTKGGHNTAENAQPLCRRCNSWKRQKTVDFRLSEVTA